ncbi:hypothetical protein C8034_v010772 [Colletotrichum sidae]|uniref:DUF7708 domain-containing protein n=1 Tax=Colletotrichum sidae TaxID=1347389 RepID=A0A4R8TID4_9PEZI|nr:hypothetical protein C8034_v010772 [Colletotrichum sidae]
MQRKPSVNTVVFRTPSWNRLDGSPTTLLSPANSWNTRDEVIRRFSDPAKEDDVETSSESYERAETSYAKVVKSLQTLLRDEGASVTLPAKHGKQELYQVARQIQKAKDISLDNKKMQKFVKSLDHYQGVFDILSQADFSGLPLIWGGLKFILLMSKNNSEMLSKVFDIIIDIGRSLERIQAYSKLYPIPRMMEFTADLYDAIVEFLEKVIKDSKKNTFTMAEDPSASLFSAIRKGLFHGFELQAGYHQELEATYKTTTSKAWVEWFKMEQRYVPSGYSHETKVIQAECDAPDPQHALVWKKQQRTLASHVPSVYLIWTRGMTAQSAIASLIDQILFQKTEVMVDAGLDMEQFREANNSLTALWNFFLYVTTVLGGCMVYITIGSVGDDEAAIVGKFVEMANSWKGPAINVTLIHPFSDEFARVDDVINLDDKYDVHPSLTTTDAMHHVLLLELNLRKRVSDTIQSLLWETVWREVRYAVIGIALAQLIDCTHVAAKKVAEKARDESDELEQATKRRIKKPFSDTDVAHWVASVAKWTDNEWSMNTLREQIQRHIDIVDIHLPPANKKRLKRKLELLVFSKTWDSAPRQLTEDQRMAIWENIQAAIRPGTGEMFCGQIEELLAAVLEDYREEGPEGEGQAKTLFVYLIKTYFGKSGRWKDSFSDDANLVSDGITEAIEQGFKDLITALSSQEP